MACYPGLLRLDKCSYPLLKNTGKGSRNICIYMNHLAGVFHVKDISLEQYKNLSQKLDKFFAVKSFGTSYSPNVAVVNVDIVLLEVMNLVLRKRGN